jgi:uncharacterized protein
MVAGTLEDTASIAMQNMHTHVLDQRLHVQPATIAESDLSRGRALDLTVKFDAFMRDMRPFDKVVVFGLKARRTGYWVDDDYVAQFVARAPEKLIGFASCDPTQTGYMDELTHAIDDLKLHGVKMGPTYAGFSPLDERCRPVYELCQSRGLPIIFHAGTTFNRLAVLKHTRPLLWDEVAMEYPDLRMVLAHLGHPFGEECICVIRKHPNLYADIAALHYRPWQFYNMLMLAQEYRVMHKLLFGTDYPFAGAQETIDGVRTVNHIIGANGLPGVSQEAVEEIIQRDALALMGVKL